MKRQNAITLVSVVVTIIILIILAGVSINAILGENGIITIAKQAKEDMEQAQTDEQIQLNELYMQMVSEGGTSGEISYDAIKKLSEFKKQIANALTEKGVTTSESDTEETIVENIKKIESATGDATTDQVLQGATFSNSDELGLTGSMPNRGELNWNPSKATTYNVPAGYYTGGVLNTTNAYNTGIAAGKAASGIERVQVGTGIGRTANTFNIASIDANYKSYTINNFGMSATYHYIEDQYGTEAQGTTTGVMSYNASTGILTVPKNVYVRQGDGTSWHFYYTISYTVYLYRTKS